MESFQRALVLDITSCNLSWLNILMSEFASQYTFSTFFLLENGPSNFYLGTWPASWRHILSDSHTVILALWPRPGQQGGNKEANCIFSASSLIWKLLALIFLFSSSIGWK